MKSTSTSTGEISAVDEPTIGFRLVVVHSSDTATIGLNLGEGVLGRDPSADYVFDDDRMSRRHLQISGRGTSLTDLGSRNGTWVNGRRLEGSGVLSLGDVVRIGDTLAVVELKERRDSPKVHEITGPSHASGRLRELVSRYAETDLPVCIIGPTGTGKEQVAKAFHRLSRRQGRFIAVNCGGISSSLAQAELFGHKRGAFTGANSDRDGSILAADGGTLFLDELGDLPLPEQAMLLRVLQDRTVVPLGSTIAQKVDFRLICATNVNLPAAITTGRFREDLYYRINDLPVKTTPLRERRADILELYREFKGPKLTVEAAQALLLRDWPANARGVQADARRLGIEASGGVVSLTLLRELGMDERSRPELPESREVPRAAPSREPLTPSAIRAAIAASGGKKSDAARRLGISRATLYRHLDEPDTGD